MELKINELLELIREQVELFEERAPSVQAQVSSGASRDMSIPFPTIKITEAWGQPDSEDRQVLELLMKNVKGNTVEEKLDSVREFLEYKPERKINEIFSNLLFTEIFSNIMDEYNASTAGFLFEAFLAGLFGGSRSLQIADKDEETGNLPIVDVELNGEPYSLKVLSPDTPVKGSFFNLINHYDKSDYVKYLVVEKRGDGVLAFREFTLDKDTFLNYIGYAPAGEEVGKKEVVKNVPAEQLGLDPDDDEPEIKGVGTFVYTDPETGEDFRVLGKLKKSSGGNYRHTSLLEGEEYDIRIERGTETKRRTTGTTGKGKTLDLYGSYELYDKLQKIKNKDKLMAALKETPGYKNNKQFIISSVYVRDTAQDIGELNLGRDKLKTVAKEYAKDLEDSLIPIYRALQEVTMNTNKYFLSDEGETGRKQHALQASGNAGTLKTETDKLIK